MTDDRDTEIYNMDGETIDPNKFDKATLRIDILELQTTTYSNRPPVTRDEFGVLISDDKQDCLMWAGPSPDRAFHEACELADAFGGNIPIIHRSMHSVPF